MLGNKIMDHMWDLAISADVPITALHEDYSRLTQSSMKGRMLEKDYWPTEFTFKFPPLTAEDMVFDEHDCDFYFIHCYVNELAFAAEMMAYQDYNGYAPATYRTR